MDTNEPLNELQDKIDYLEVDNRILRIYIQMLKEEIAECRVWSNKGLNMGCGNAEIHDLKKV